MGYGEVMGLYFSKCIKCGHITWFCSVDLTCGKTCDCGDEYLVPCDPNGKELNREDLGW